MSITYRLSTPTTTAPSQLKIHPLKILVPVATQLLVAARPAGTCSDNASSALALKIVRFARFAVIAPELFRFVRFIVAHLGGYRRAGIRCRVTRAYEIINRLHHQHQEVEVGEVGGDDVRCLLNLFAGGRADDQPQ